MVKQLWRPGTHPWHQVPLVFDVQHDEPPLKPATCTFFRPGIISPNICAKWITPLKPGKPPFCLADEECSTQGLRWAPRVDSDDDGEID